jgi:hypothetical protein
MRLLLASAVAEAVDVEKLLWVPKPIVTVPARPMELVILDTMLTNISISYKMPDGFICEQVFPKSRVIIYARPVLAPDPARGVLVPTDRKMRA